nr:MAG TPA: terminase large subunit [Caudoviricetes sp.]
MHAVVVRKVANTLRTSVFNQIQWAVSELGLYGKFKFTVSPMEITYRKTGQKILFFGMDDAAKLKSLKVPFGYVGILWFEELDQFGGEEEVRNVEQSVLRGGDLSYCFKTFNPPITAANWANQYVMRQKPGQVIHHSTYLTTPDEWLGKKFLDDADFLRESNPKAYEHEYMGVPTGTGGAVFENVEPRVITKEERDRFDRVYNGVDWGYYPDPWAFNRVHYDAARRTLYIFDEITKYKSGNRETADAIARHGVTGTDLITADSAEPKSVGDYKRYGLFCRGAKKGPGSVEYSHKWLQSLNRIVIDPQACPDTLKEFIEYEYDRAKDGSIVSGYPDKNNHHIDAVRYATETIWQKNGVRI